jgi:flagellin
MSSYINTNTTASEASYNLGINQANEQKNIQRLSSGLRINSAADDAAGLVISESLRAQSAGLTQATRNTNDAINVVKTAEGALNEVHSLLINIRSLVVHAANVGANDPTALKADQDAIASAVSSINRIAGTTQFNNKNLLDGSASSSSAAVTGGTATVNAATGKTLALVSQAAGYGATAIASGNVTSTAAVAESDTATFGATPGAGTFGGSFTVEGKAVNLNGTTNTLAQVATAIQQQTGLNYAVTQAAGVVTFTNQVAGASGGTTTLTGLTSSTASTGTPTQANVTTGANGSLTVNGQTSDTVSADGKTFSFTTGALKGLSLSTSSTLGTTLGTFSATADKAVAGQDLQFQVGANAGQTVNISIGSTKASSLGSSGGFNLGDLAAGGALNVTDPTGVGQQNALKVVDQAIADVSTTREHLGALQSNVLESNVRSLGVAQQNTDASESTIRDTNLSSEIVDFTKNQILVQAGTSALAQANSAPQAILKLLQ